MQDVFLAPVRPCRLPAKREAAAVKSGSKLGQSLCRAASQLHFGSSQARGLTLQLAQASIEHIQPRPHMGVL